MTTPGWLSVVVLGVLGGGIVVLLVWMGRSEAKNRRQAQAAAQLAEKYRTVRPGDTVRRRDRTAGHDLTVADLVERSLNEGYAVRLNWEDGEPGTPRMEEWPTGVLPRVDWDDEEPM